MTIGIEKINAYVPPYKLSLKKLAEKRGVDPNKFLIGLGQTEMAVNLNHQDIITLGAKACDPMLTKADRQKISLIITGTESSTDESKAASTLFHQLLNIQPFASSFEIKEACYGATAGLLMAKDYLKSHPEDKVLVIATDIARYGLNTPGEVTQGAGSMAMLLSNDAKILSLEDDAISYTENIYDFWRPTGEKYPRVEGKLSNETYIAAFKKVFVEYLRKTKLSFEDFSALVFHTPYTKMGKKALLPLLEEFHPQNEAELLKAFEKSIHYSKQIGNLYTGSLYLSLLSLLEEITTLKTNDRIGLFSYGSGSVASFFTGKILPDYQQALPHSPLQAFLNTRRELTIAEYEAILSHQEVSYNQLPKTAFERIKIEQGIPYYQPK